MAAPKKFVFNFSSEAAPDNYIRRPTGTQRRKRTEVVESPAVWVDDNDSPLFEPLSKGTPDQTEVGQHPQLPRLVICTYRVAQKSFQPADASEGRVWSTNAKVSACLPTACLQLTD
jgi:hypothetical protein